MVEGDVPGGVGQPASVPDGPGLALLQHVAPEHPLLRGVVGAGRRVHVDRRRVLATVDAGRRRSARHPAGVGLRRHAREAH